MHVVGQKIPTLINHCGPGVLTVGDISTTLSPESLTGVNYPPSTTAVLYCTRVISFKPDARWTLSRLVRLVRAQIDILHGDEKMST